MIELQAKTPGARLRTVALRACALVVAVSICVACSPEEPADEAQAPTSPAATEAVYNPNKCMAPHDIEDRDGDIERNLDALSSDALCLKQEVFQEGSLFWVLQIIQNKAMPDKVLWVVPHDNENAAFDTAVYGVTKYGGTVVAVETGGRRLNGPQDPNRNFDANTGGTCLKQIAPSPEYTRRVLKWMRHDDEPIIALHTNERGYAGDDRGGVGVISILKPPPGSMVYPTRFPLAAASPDDTMVFVASVEPKSRNPRLAALVDQLNELGIHVIYELVSPTQNDCSLSNFVALANKQNYLNVEVVDNDGETQRKIVNTILQALWP